MDTYNAKMGAFGNYIISTQEHVTGKFNALDGQLQNMEQKLSTFNM
jgi:hypothetical protein